MGKAGTIWIPSLLITARGCDLFNSQWYQTVCSQGTHCNGKKKGYSHHLPVLKTTGSAALQCLFEKPLSGRHVGNLPSSPCPRGCKELVCSPALSLFFAVVIGSIFFCEAVFSLPFLPLKVAGNVIRVGGTNSPLFIYFVIVLHRFYLGMHALLGQIILKTTEQCYLCYCKLGPTDTWCPVPAGGMEIYLKTLLIVETNYGKLDQNISV